MPLFVRTQAEMGHTCRGTINLATATITVDDACNFVISNGGAQTYHLKASCEVERQRWITALELAKAKAARMQAESGETHKQQEKSLTQRVLALVMLLWRTLFGFPPVNRRLGGRLLSIIPSGGAWTRWCVTELGGPVCAPNAGQ